MRTPWLLVTLLAVNAPAPLLAAPGNISTVAGGPGQGPALSVGQRPAGVTVSGPFVYVADEFNQVVRRLDTRTGQEIVVAGNGLPGFSGDGGPATSAELSGAGCGPTGVGLRVQAGLNNDRWDLSADFSATNNPNGPWSYGWTESDGSRFTLGTAYQRVAGLDAWGGFRADDGNPSIAHNGCDSDCGVPMAVTIDNYPKIDGSTSTLPLARVIACELLGLNFEWVAGIGDEGAAEIVAVPKTVDQNELADAVNQKIVHNKTHQAYLNLVDATADLILVANPPSADEAAYAQAAGVTLKWDPVALDALVMLVNSSNPVTTLTKDQIRGIFMAEITSWDAVGGGAGEIHPYVRPINSGSQQLFNAIVMTGLTMPTWPPDQTSSMMGGLLDAVAFDSNSIGYSVYYYVTYQRPTHGAKIIAVDGVMPTAETIGTQTYPFTAPVLVVIRENLDPDSLAYQMRQWLLSPDGQAVVAKSGYVPVLQQSGPPSGTPSPTPTQTPSPSVTPTATGTPTLSATATPTVTVPPTLTATATPSPSVTTTATTRPSDDGGGGCTVTSGHNNGGAWWLFVGALALACRRRAGQKP